MGPLSRSPPRGRVSKGLRQQPLPLGGQRLNRDQPGDQPVFGAGQAGAAGIEQRAALAISGYAAAKHVAAPRAQTGLSNRTGAVAAARAAGLLQ